LSHLFDEMSIEWEERGRAHCFGHLVIDPQFAVVDVMAAMLLDLSEYRLCDLILLDGEISYGGETPSLLDQVIYVFEPMEFANMFIPGRKARVAAAFQSGQRFDGGRMEVYPNPKMNPPLLDSGILLLKTWLSGHVTAEQVARLRLLPNVERNHVHVPSERENA
jgi:hypothetical protein